MMQNTLNTPQLSATINTSQPSNRHAKQPKQSQYQSHTIPLPNNYIRCIPGVNLMDKFAKTTTTAPNVSAIPEPIRNQQTKTNHTPQPIPTPYKLQPAQRNGKQPMISQNHPSAYSHIHAKQPMQNRETQSSTYVNDHNHLH
jgi:hypothetical protein